MTARRWLGRLAAAGLAAVMAVTQATACTGIMLRAKDGSTVSGRTLEFGIFIDTDVVLVPRGMAFTGLTPLGDGMEWKATYAAVGAIAFGNLAILDGMNEKGLSVGAFYFPTFAGYTETTEANRATSLSMADFPNWLLTSFATVEEVRAAIAAGKVAIAPTILPGWPPEVQPFHYVVYDRTGASIVIEPVAGSLQVFDNPLGVITNSPGFDWHMTNLRNYIALDPRNVPSITVDDTTFRALGQGTGMLGLPGDFTPPSRFVRAAVFSATAVPPADAASGVLQVFHILNAFDIPVGVARDESGGQMHTDYTIMTAARDPQALQYFWKTYDDQTIRMVDMTKLDLDADHVVKLSTAGTQPIADMTAGMK